MMEIWKDINGYEGFYQVSNLGRVRSIATRRCIHGVLYVINRERIMKPTDNGNGYLVVGFKCDGKRKNFYVHRLVAEHFIDNPDGLDTINHLDYDRSNNCADNLEWCTQKDNVRYSAPNMRKPKRSANKGTGEKYIKHRDNRYELNITQFKFFKSFKSLEEAIECRDDFMNDHRDYYEKGVI